MVEQAFQAQALYQDNLLAKPNVVGVAVGFKESKGESTGELSVVVLVEQKKPLAALSAEEMVPPSLDGMRTDVFEVGRLRAFDTPRDRFRPVIPSGVSIGHYKVTAGTLGTVCYDRATGAKLLLSNNHVFANANDAMIGDPILQPGSMDGGQNPADVVARLERFVKMYYKEDPPTPTPPGGDGGGNAGCANGIVLISNLLLAVLNPSQKVTTMSKAAAATTAPQIVNNLVDCAVARPLDPNMFSGEIRGIGQVAGTKPAALGMRVRKSGRTTDYTEATITLLNATVSISYGTSTNPKTAQFTGQIVTQAMSQGGDSGSLLVDAADNKAVGLLFAGSSLTTLFNPIDQVLNALNITL